MTCSVLYFTAPDGETKWRCPKTFGTKEEHFLHEVRCWRYNCPGATPINPESLCHKRGCNKIRRNAKDAKYCSDNCRKNAYRDRQKVNPLPT